MTLDLIALRREFHEYPEPAFCEIRTASRIAQTLAAIGIEPRIGESVIDTTSVVDYPSEPVLDAATEFAVQTGADRAWADRVRKSGTAVIADIVGDRPGPQWGLRVDIDALPIQESTAPDHFPAGSGFVSAVADVMHACGHDGHAAIGLKLAERLVQDPSFPGRLRIIFQPAEEGGRGARSMVGTGVVDDIDRMLAIHLGLDLPNGHVIGGSSGSFATTKLRARFTGAAAHAAASPQEGRNALAAAAAATLAVLAQPRFSTADTRVNVGTLHGGEAVNIIPSWAELTAESRAVDDAVMEDLCQRIVRSIENSAAAFDCSAEVIETGGCPTMSSNHLLAQHVSDVAASLGATTDVLGGMSGTDDASLFMRRVTERGGVADYIQIGAGNPHPHHSPKFDIEESSLDFSVDLLEKLLRTRADDM